MLPEHEIERAGTYFDIGSLTYQRAGRFRIYSAVEYVGRTQPASGTILR